MFPARAGMSRVIIFDVLSCAHVPRASGDEPLYRRVKKSFQACSPRERG